MYRNSLKNHLPFMCHYLTALPGGKADRSHIAKDMLPLDTDSDEGFLDN